MVGSLVGDSVVDVVGAAVGGVVVVEVDGLFVGDSVGAAVKEAGMLGQSQLEPVQVKLLAPLILMRVS